MAPGFIDAHVHIESAMVVVTEFARAVVPRGTTTVWPIPTRSPTSWARRASTTCWRGQPTSP